MNSQLYFLKSIGYIIPHPRRGLFFSFTVSTMLGRQFFFFLYYYFFFFFLSLRLRETRETRLNTWHVFSLTTTRFRAVERTFAAVTYRRVAFFNEITRCRNFSAVHVRIFDTALNWRSIEAESSDSIIVAYTYTYVCVCVVRVRTCRQRREFRGKARNVQIDTRNLTLRV